MSPNLTLLPEITPAPITQTTATPSPAPTAGWHKLYEANMIETWPAWCVKPDDHGQASVPLLPLEVEDFCFNQSSSHVVANIAVEWRVRVNHGSALLLFGQNNRFYRIELQPDERTITVREVSDFVRGNERILETIRSAAIHPKAGAKNTVMLVRREQTLTLTVNGEMVTEFPDALFGDHAPLAAGIGAATEGDDGATLYLESLSMYVPGD